MIDQTEYLYADDTDSGSISTEREVDHELKCWPQFYCRILNGEKRHDLRRITDRSFNIGEILKLREFDPILDRYSGRSLSVEITYITSSEVPCALSQDALHSDFCILSIRLL